MPVYEYKCLKCGKVFEELVNKSSQKYVECPDCEDTAVLQDKIYPVKGYISGARIAQALNSPDDDD